jgi:hypothetical protein
VRSNLVDGNWLRAWVKCAGAPRDEAFYIEVDDTVLSSANLSAVARHCSPSAGNERLQALLERPLGFSLR